VRRLFVDSGGFFAHLVVDDANHRVATDIFQKAIAEAWELHTTNAVLFETQALLVNRARNGRAIALEFLEQVDEGLCQVERVSIQDESDAIEVLRAYSDKNFSFCDALSFVVMERKDVREVLAFDRHFNEYGRFKVLQ